MGTRGQRDAAFLFAASQAAQSDDERRETVTHARPGLTIRLAGAGPALGAGGVARVARAQGYRRDRRLEQGCGTQVEADPGP